MSAFKFEQGDLVKLAENHMSYKIYLDTLGKVESCFRNGPEPGHLICYVKFKNETLIVSASHLISSENSVNFILST